MFVPKIYRQPDDNWMLDLIRSNPLALLVSAGTGTSGVHATHVPIILDPGTETRSANLRNARLLGHMNRSNPHWAALEAGEALVAFTGPHAYVSPTVYRTSPAAPTWNFTAVHVRGAVQRLDAADLTMDVVQSTVRAFEAEFDTGWDMSGSVGYFRKILPAVGAFRIHVRQAEAMVKLSQEQPSEVRERVRLAFERGTAGRHREVARLMCRWKEEREA